MRGGGAPRGEILIFIFAGQRRTFGKRFRIPERGGALWRLAANDGMRRAKKFRAEAAYGCAHGHVSRDRRRDPGFFQAVPNRCGGKPAA